MDVSQAISVIQTLILAITLIYFALQTRLQVRALRLIEYSKCREDYTSLIRMLVEKGELHSVYDSLSKQRPDQWNWEKYSREDKVLYNYLELNLELLERVFVLRSRKWVDEVTWLQWNNWLKELVLIPLFRDVWMDNKGMFDDDFMRHVGSLMTVPVDLTPKQVL